MIEKDLVDVQYNLPTLSGKGIKKISINSDGSVKYT
jgi:hypothetical protein